MTYSRRVVLAAAFGSALRSLPVRAAGRSLRIGYQKNGPLVILRQQRRLEQVLDGVAVQWTLFQSGPPLLEALNAGAIDFGATGDTPPIFAQAAGVDFVYVASQASPGRSSAILVQANGSIKSVADLKGRRIAFTKGSSAHYQTVRTLGTVGLTLADVQPVYLQPAEARAAFQSGAVEAWTIWDPFYAVAERDPGVRVLINGEVAPSNSFFLARRAFAAQSPDLVIALVQEINGAAKWSDEHTSELAQIMADVTGVDLAAQRVAAERGRYATAFLTDAVIGRQQEIADTFSVLGVLPGRIEVRAAVWLPPEANNVPR